MLCCLLNSTNNSGELSMRRHNFSAQSSGLVRHLTRRKTVTVLDWARRPSVALRSDVCTNQLRLTVIPIFGMLYGAFPRRWTDLPTCRSTVSSPPSVDPGLATRLHARTQSTSSFVVGYDLTGGKSLTFEEPFGCLPTSGNIHCCLGLHQQRFSAFSLKHLILDECINVCWHSPVMATGKGLRMAGGGLNN